MASENHRPSEKPKRIAQIITPSTRKKAIDKIGPRKEKSLPVKNTTAVRPAKRHKLICRLTDKREISYPAPCNRFV